MQRTLQILEQLIAFPTISRTPNIQLIEYVQSLLTEAGIDCQVYRHNGGSNANLFAHTGPADRPGIVLSGHTDVVPVEGQDWSCEPFAMSERQGRYFGRGTTDMKGFVACAIDAMLLAAEKELSTPLQLALSYDEEIGCIGVRSLIDTLQLAPVKPAFCIVGEPTEMKVANGHKGKTAMRAICRGREAHSALAPQGVNAIYLASELIAILRDEQAQLVAAGKHDNHYEIPYTTIHTGTIKGGTALNIVPNLCELEFEIRNIADDDPQAILQRVQQRAEQVAAQWRDQHDGVEIELQTVNSYPGLDTAANSEVVAFVRSLLDDDQTIKVAFGTEGGLFNQILGTPTVVCGPGSMQQGHKPDEFISAEQIQACEKMMQRLLQRIA